MDYQFYSFEFLEEFGEIMPFVAIYLGLIAGVYLLYLLAQLAQYVFRSLSLYTLAKRRGLNQPWLAWIPVGSDWIRGSVADQYLYLTAGKISNKRKIMLGLRIGMIVSGATGVVMAITMIVRLMQFNGSVDMLFMPIVGNVLVVLATAVVSVVHMVFFHICRYHMYQSCEPKNGIAYMVLGLVFPILDTVFMFLCRNKDEGMPPRKEQAVQETEPEEPVLIPELPVNEQEAAEEAAEGEEEAVPQEENKEE